MDDPARLADDRLAELFAAADGDDATLLRLLAAEAENVAAYTRRVHAMRDQVVARMSVNGVPLIRLAVLARVTDSYLSRRLRRILQRD